jgi:hypothetical protein
VFLKILMTADHCAGSQHTLGTLSYHNVPLSFKEHATVLLSVNGGETVTIAINPLILSTYLNSFWTAIHHSFLNLFHFLHIIILCGLYNIMGCLVDYHGPLVFRESQFDKHCSRDFLWVRHILIFQFYNPVEQFFVLCHGRNNSTIF